MQSFLGSYVHSRCGLSPEEITAFFELQNIFRGGEGRLSFIKFRELFFPHLTLAGEDQHVLDKKVNNIELKTAAQKSKLTQEVQERVRKLNE